MPLGGGSGKDPVRLRVEQGLVGHVHLNVLAEHQGEGGVLEQQVRDVCLAHADPVVQPGKLVEPPCGRTIFLGEIYGSHVAAAAFGDVAGGSADSAARVEDLVVGVTWTRSASWAVAMRPIVWKSSSRARSAG